MYTPESKKLIFVLNLSLLLLPISLLLSNFVSEILISIIIFIFFLNITRKNLLEIINNKTIILLLILTLYLIINYLLNFDKNPSITRSFLFIRFPLYVIALSYFLNSSLINNRNIYYFWGVLIFFTCLDLQLQSFTGQNIFGYEYIRQGGSLNQSGEFYGGFKRLGGFMNSELKIAYLINNFFVISLGALAYYKKNNYHLIMIFLFTCVTFYSVYLTGERANFLCLIVFIVGFVLASNVKKYFLLIIFILTILINYNYFELKKNHLMERMIFKNTKTIINILNTSTETNKNFLYKNDQYFAHYSTAWEIFKNYPIFGVGLKNFRVYCQNPIYSKNVTLSMKNRNCTTHPHNLYFEILSELGIMGSLIFFISFGYFFYICIKKSYREKHMFLFGNTIFLMTYFIPFLPRGSFFTNWNAMIFWTLFAVTFHLLNTKKVDS
jgi:O-antigen ligase